MYQLFDLDIQILNFDYPFEVLNFSIFLLHSGTNTWMICSRGIIHDYKHWQYLLIYKLYKNVPYRNNTPGQNKLVTHA